jgi:hypothetical protein
MHLHHSPALAPPLQPYRAGLAGGPRTGWSRPCMQHTCMWCTSVLLLENTHAETQSARTHASDKLALSPVSTAAGEGDGDAGERVQQDKESVFLVS